MTETKRGAERGAIKNTGAGPLMADAELNKVKAAPIAEGGEVGAVLPVQLVGRILSTKPCKHPSMGRQCATDIYL